MYILQKKKKKIEMYYSVSKYYLWLKQKQVQNKKMLI